MIKRMVCSRSRRIVVARSRAPGNFECVGSVGLSIRRPVVVVVSNRTHLVSEGLMRSRGVEVRIGKIRRFVEAALIRFERLTQITIVLKRDAKVKVQKRGLRAMIERVQ
jgi:hypothetical protein